MFGVVPGPDRQGVQIVHLVKALSSRFGVDVLTLRSGDLGYVERFHDTRMLRVPIPEAGLLEQVEAFRRAVRRQLDGADYDVVHCRDVWAAQQVIDAGHSLGFRTVFEVGRSATELSGLPEELANSLREAQDQAINKADLVLVPSEFAAESLSRMGRPEGVGCVTPGVDVDRFDYDLSDLKGPPRVMYVGPIGPGRGIRVLLKAMAEVRKETNARLTLVGAVEPGFMPAFSAAVKAAELNSHIEVFGPIENSDMPRVISAATACVAPQVSDRGEHPLSVFPTKILEYMACRRPVVAARRPGIEEVIEENIDGLLFAPGDAADLAKKIVRMLVDAPMRRGLAEAAHRRVRARFPASATRRQYVQAYTELLPPETWKPLSESAAPIPTGRPGDTTGVSQPELALGDSLQSLNLGALSAEFRHESKDEEPEEVTEPAGPPSEWDGPETIPSLGAESHETPTDVRVPPPRTIYADAVPGGTTSGEIESRRPSGPPPGKKEKS